MSAEAAQQPRGRAKRFVTLAIALLAAGYALLPLLWAGVSAFRPSGDIFRYLSPLSVRSFAPNQVTTANFAKLGGFIHVAMVNSLVVASATVLIGLSVSVLAAFALAVLRFRGRSAVFTLVVVSFLVPFDAIAIPLSSEFRSLNLQNTLVGLILPGVGNGLAVFLLRQFFLDIPRELVEAARVDGKGWPTILGRIYLPLSRPALIGAGIILFMFQWESFLWPLLIAPAPNKQVAPVALAEFAGQYSTDFGAIFAGSVLTCIVPLLIVLLFQRHFTESIAATGGKE